MDFRTTGHRIGSRLNHDGWFSLDRIGTMASATAYWLAVGLPLLYMSVLAIGIETRSGIGLFLGLLAFHLLALVCGRNYDPGTGSLETDADTLTG